MVIIGDSIIGPFRVEDGVKFDFQDILSSVTAPENKMFERAQAQLYFA